MEYHYFISYSYSNGFGNAEVTRKKKITRYEEIAEVKEQIEHFMKIKDVIIINYIFLRKGDK